VNAPGGLVFAEQPLGDILVSSTSNQVALPIDDARFPFLGNEVNALAVNVTGRRLDVGAFGDMSTALGSEVAPMGVCSRVGTVMDLARADDGVLWGVTFTGGVVAWSAALAASDDVGIGVSAAARTSRPGVRSVLPIGGDRAVVGTSTGIVFASRSGDAITLGPEVTTVSFQVLSTFAGVARLVPCTVDVVSLTASCDTDGSVDASGAIAGTAVHRSVTSVGDAAVLVSDDEVNVVRNGAAVDVGLGAASFVGDNSAVIPLVDGCVMLLGGDERPLVIDLGAAQGTLTLAPATGVAPIQPPPFRGVVTSPGRVLLFDRGGAVTELTFNPAATSCADIGLQQPHDQPLGPIRPTSTLTAAAFFAGTAWVGDDRGRLWRSSSALTGP
jgi:hypothetical protein